MVLVSSTYSEPAEVGSLSPSLKLCVASAAFCEVQHVVVLILGGIGVLRLVDGEGDLVLGTEYVGCCCGLEVTGLPWVAIK